MGWVDIKGDIFLLLLVLLQELFSLEIRGRFTIRLLDHQDWLVGISLGQGDFPQIVVKKQDYRQSMLLVIILIFF